MAMKQGDVVWHDLMTTDLAAAADFYARVVGWTVTDSGLPGTTYMICSAGTTPVAGLMPIPEPAQAAGMTPKWMGYVGVEDVDAKAEELKAAGGAVHRGPEDIPGVGRFAYVADPHGAGFYLFRGTASRRPRCRSARRARSAGTSSMLAMARRRSTSIRACSAGPRTRRSRWGRWGPTSSSPTAARRSAA